MMSPEVPNHDDRKCQRCCFWRRLFEADGAPRELGKCWHSPPQAVVRFDKLAWLQPETEPDYFCYQFSPGGGSR